MGEAVELTARLHLSRSGLFDQSCPLGEVALHHDSAAPHARYETLPNLEMDVFKTPVRSQGQAPAT